ncbi:hypothetical protein [Streptomyces sp. RFCAC02]|uniref:hypothetical protein n=1 Tax=Streptomyces sp. RFCAC02 TaxID=2499143 RepID=UPI00101F8228|nr:hypothetical protein [Streptomyces sp. RFCAC02]
MSRRSVLAVGAGVGVSGVMAGRAVAADVSTRGGGGGLVLDYRPAQPTGWPVTPGKSFATTLGGNVTAAEFDFGGRRYSVGLSAPDPVYIEAPSDPDLAFESTLEAGFGEHYAFRYLGGLPRGAAFSVQCHSVFATGPTDEFPQTSFGGGVYAEYLPGGSGGGDALRWIQVARWLGAGSGMPSRVDNFDRANPFYLYGGSTSVDGRRVCNFHDIPQKSVDGTMTLDDGFVAEAFLARDTGRTDGAGRGVVELLGGLRYGWQVEEVQGLSDGS